MDIEPIRRLAKREQSAITAEGHRLLSITTPAGANPTMSIRISAST
jgi:hypothetical protein